MRRAGRLAASAALALALSACAGMNRDSARESDPKMSSGSLTGDVLVARVASGDRDTDVAAARYGYALAADPDNLQLLERAFIFSLSAGEMDEAGRFAELLIARKDEAPLAHVTLGILALKRGNPAEAVTQLEQAGGRGSSFTGAMLGSWALAAAGRSDDALAALEHAPDRMPNARFIQYHAALIASLAGKAAEAEQAYKDALGADQRRNPRLVRAYAAFLDGQGRHDEALALLKETEGGAGEDPGVAAARREALSGSRITPVVATAREGMAEVLYGLAGALISDRGVDLPLVYLQLALALEPDFDIAAMLQGEIYESLEKWEDAARAYSRVGRSSPYHPRAQIELARLDARDDNVDKAVERLARIGGTGPARFDALVAAGDVLRGAERWDEAADAYGKAVALIAAPKESDWTVYYAQGIALERAGRWPEAEKQLQHALTIKPDQPLVLNYLGYTWIEHGVNLEKALAMIERAVEQRPNDGFILDSLGWAYYRLGKYADSVEILEQAVLMQPGEATINDHLGDAYWRVGREREARFQWSHALTFEPEAGEVPVIRAKLDHGLDAAASAGTPKPE